MSNKKNLSVQSRKKKVLIYSHCYIYGGSERLMKSIYCSDYLNEKYNIIFAYSFNKDYHKSLSADNALCKKDTKFIPLYILTNSNLFYKINISIWNKNAKLIAKIPFYIFQIIGIYFLYNIIYFFIYMIYYKPDIVHINNGGYPASETCNQLALVLLLFRNTKVVYQVNNQPRIEYNIISIIRNFIINLSVDIFVLHSNQNAEILRKLFQNKNIKNFFSFFEETTVGKDIDINMIKVKEINLCSIGFLTKRKGHIFLLKALTHIRELYPKYYSQIFLHIVGDGEENNHLNKYIIENNHKDNVKIWGYRSDYKSIIINSEIFLLPSLYNEDFPLVLITALKYGKCIITTNFAGMSELLTDKYNSLLVNPNEINLHVEIANAIVYLINNPKNIAEYGNNAKFLFSTKLGKKNYEINIDNIYKKKF